MRETANNKSNTWDYTQPELTGGPGFLWYEPWCASQILLQINVISDLSLILPDNHPTTMEDKGKTSWLWMHWERFHYVKQRWHNT